MGKCLHQFIYGGGDCHSLFGQMFVGLRGLWISSKYFLWLYEISHKHGVCLPIAHWTCLFWDPGPGRGCVWQILTGFIVPTARLLLLSIAGYTTFVFWV